MSVLPRAAVKVQPSVLQVSMRLPLGGPDPFGKAPTEDVVLALTYQGHRQVVCN